MLARSQSQEKRSRKNKHSCHFCQWERRILLARAMYLWHNFIRFSSGLGYFVWHIYVSECVWLIACSIAAFSPRNFTWPLDFLGDLNRSDSFIASSNKCFHLQLPISPTVFSQFLSFEWEGGFQRCVYCSGISSSTAPISCNCYFHTVPWQWQIYTYLQVFLLKTATAIKSKPHLLVCPAQVVFFFPLFVLNSSTFVQTQK